MMRERILYLVSAAAIAIALAFAMSITTHVCINGAGMSIELAMSNSNNSKEPMVTVISDNGWSQKLYEPKKIEVEVKSRNFTSEYIENLKKEVLNEVRGIPEIESYLSEGYRVVDIIPIVVAKLVPQGGIFVLEDVKVTKAFVVLAKDGIKRTFVLDLEKGRVSNSSKLPVSVNVVSIATGKLVAKNITRRIAGMDLARVWELYQLCRAKVMEDPRVAKLISEGFVIDGVVAKFHLKGGMQGEYLRVESWSFVKCVAVLSKGDLHKVIEITIENQRGNTTSNNGLEYIA